MEFFRLFYTDMPLVPGSGEPDLSLILPLEFATPEEALDEAFKLMAKGAIVWRIEGPESFRMNRADIERKYHAMPHAA